MTNDDFKKILDEALKSIHEKLDSHSQKLDSHSGALVSIESKLDAYGDMYKINDSNIRKIEKRVKVIEANAEIKVPSELQLTDVS